MSRAVKQVLYGLLYLLIFGAIATGIFFRFLKPVASCFDHAQNQGEQGIDCGGPCANICMANLRAIEPMSVYLFPNAIGRATLLATIVNPNADFGVDPARYAFEISDADTGTKIQSISGSAFLYPNQTRYIVVPNYPIGAGPLSSLHANLSVVTSDIAWVPSSTMGAIPVFSFSNVMTTSTASGTVTISGILGSQTAVALKNIEMDFIFENQSQTPVGATRTVIDQIAANGSIPFSVTFPLIADMAAANTVIAAY